MSHVQVARLMSDCATIENLVAVLVEALHKVELISTSGNDCGNVCDRVCYSGQIFVKLASREKLLSAVTAKRFCIKDWISLTQIPLLLRFYALPSFCTK